MDGLYVVVTSAIFGFLAPFVWAVWRIIFELADDERSEWVYEFAITQLSVAMRRGVVIAIVALAAAIALVR